MGYGRRIAELASAAGDVVPAGRRRSMCVGRRFGAGVAVRLRLAVHRPGRAGRPAGAAIAQSRLSSGSRRARRPDREAARRVHRRSAGGPAGRRRAGRLAALLPVRFVADMARAAEIIDPGGRASPPVAKRPVCADRPDVRPDRVGVQPRRQAPLLLLAVQRHLADSPALARRLLHRGPRRRVGRLHVPAAAATTSGSASVGSLGRSPGWRCRSPCWPWAALRSPARPDRLRRRRPARVGVAVSAVPADAARGRESSPGDLRPAGGARRLLPGAVGVYVFPSS